jgi:hypothetical protein
MNARFSLGSVTVLQVAFIDHLRSHSNMEWNMKRNFFSTLAASAVFSGIAMLSTGAAEASMTSRLHKCQFNTKSQVVNCCERIVKHKKPFWMAENNGSCNTAAVCITKSVNVSTAITHVAFKTVKVCYIQIVPPAEGGGGNESGTETPGGRTPSRSITRPNF